MQHYVYIMGKNRTTPRGIPEEWFYLEGEN
jgi:hypothetical protein